MWSPRGVFPPWLLPPLCESCIRSVGLNSWELAPWSRQLCNAYLADDGPIQISSSPRDWDIKPAHAVVCRACGCGDNTIGHWTGWCVVPLIVALAILEPTDGTVTLDHLACQGPRQAAVCTLILACFRKLLRQEGPFSTS